ncbi:MAG TPA: hypothetical protein VIK14_05615 [Ignavibacteria bacterium]
MKKIIFVLLTFIFYTDFTLSQQDTYIWDKFEYLIGNWISSGNPEEGKSYFSFRKDLDGKVLVRKNHAEYPAKDNKPPVIHDDMLVIYLDNGKPGKAIHFDNEEHVIYYTIKYNDSDSSIVFTSDILVDIPRFRLTYNKLNDENVYIKFEFAPPGNPDSFSTYLEGKAHKEK